MSRRAARLLVALTLPVLLVACASTPMPQTDPSLPNSPLQECPGTPNCERLSLAYEASAADLRAAAIGALEDLGPAELDANAEVLHAVYRAFVFKDDVHIAIASTGNGSVLHIRSASRVGRSDLGVNARRVSKYLKALDRRLGNA
jgi:uncharacterized protein (DUF1499 family)